MDALIVNACVYLTLHGVFFLAEYWRPARPVRYRQAVPIDVLALIAYQAFFFLAVQLTDRIPVPDYVNWRIHALPVPVRIVLFVLAADFCAYWMHRLWHTGPVWRIHRWHHSPTQLYWLAGVRASFPQVVLANIPFVLALPLLQPIPAGFLGIYAYVGVFTNNWMHMNVTWRSAWLEKIFVTPRYHRLHHSMDDRLANKNFGVLFTIWDRLFGTYQDPDLAAKDVAYGIKDRLHPVRLALGM